MSRASHRGGELVDCGSWGGTSVPQPPPPLSSSRTSSHQPTEQRQLGSSNRSTTSSSTTALSRSSAFHPSSHPHPSSSFPSGATHWLDSEPVTVGVDQFSDRPLYCLSVNPSTNAFVTGGADHSLRVYDLASGAMRRELYSKTSGHIEWVTSCSYLSDGRIVSGGMDGKVILWPTSGTRAFDYVGHRASVSKVMANGPIAISSSYDKSMKVWSTGMRANEKELMILQGGSSALTTFDWHNSLVVSGSREGEVGLWDINTGQNVRWMKSIGQGQVLTLQFGSIDAGCSTQSNEAQTDPTNGDSWLIASGGGDGYLRLYDIRSESCIFQKRLSEGKPGSVNDAAFGDGMLVAALADGYCTILDARAGFVTSGVLTGHRSPVQCVKLPPNNKQVVCSAGSNGWIIVHDLSRLSEESSIQAAYALGVTTAGGVSSMWVGEKAIVCAGDDGQATILQY